MFVVTTSIFTDMKILLCNDDGIHAPGIATLHRAVSHLGDLHVCAPATERSAAGHAITIYDPIRSIPVEKENGFTGFAVDGTPADCVKLAVSFLHKDNPPDLVVSGINLGSNTGISVLYSGTVSAASEAAILGVPSVALSLCTYRNPQWETAARVAADIVEKVISNPLPDGVLLNVNIPNLPYEKIKGMRVGQMGRSRFIEKFTEHQDPRGNKYYWLDGDMKMLDDNAETDERLVSQGYVALTPIHIDLTARHCLERVSAWNADYQ
ncbi:MAG: 5'/3'-nucleotidase SurE [Pontiellaceae bacterium]|nr:5'/3'-nucleotidase SurE [Pontiellaceae bacterium]MBN2784237.1 5'/3'-nucleotidase SurE [Pontiellaceae bacterium]